MRKRREVQLFSISFLDLLSGALGAVIILYVAIPKNQKTIDDPEKIKIEQELVKLKKENQDLIYEKKTWDELKTELLAAKVDEQNIQTQLPEVGFRFKGKKIVFVIDTSGSMLDEDRLSQVKAGLKMLITSLPSSYFVDVIQFPYELKKPFRELWGQTRQMSFENKEEIYRFVYSLRADGSTPTRDVLTHLLKKYETISDIVLLSDGAPTGFNQREEENIEDLLGEMRLINTNKVQINTIGVGRNFYQQKDTAYFQFLSLLAHDHQGFFVGF